MNRFLLLLAAVCLYSLSAAAQGNNYAQNYKKFDNLALTPPMGWNSWNKFNCNVDEKLIREVADAMVATGMKDAGYTYVNIDDCWHGDRDSLGFIHPDPKRFPSGMKALADYIHSKGLKFGIYSDAGSQTCGGRPGSRVMSFRMRKPTPVGALTTSNTTGATQKDSRPKARTKPLLLPCAKPVARLY